MIDIIDAEAIKAAGKELNPSGCDAGASLRSAPDHPNFCLPQ